MKVLIFLLVAALFVFSTFYDEFANSDNKLKQKYKVENKYKKVEMLLPDFEFLDLEGNKHLISEYKGRPILLNFWASWCGPCLQEFPHIMKLIKNNKELIFVAISNDQHLSDIKKFINKFKKEYSDVLSTKQVIFAWDSKREIASDKFNVIKLPETFIINKNLKIVRKIVGANDWANDNLESFLQAL